MANPANHIRTLRASRGWTAQQLADAVGTTHATISRIEQGKQALTLEWMVLLAKALDVETSELIDGMTSLAARRNRGLNDLAAVITELWGHRCPRHEGTCGCCAAWTIFDCLERMTDSDHLIDMNPVSHKPSLWDAKLEETASEGYRSLQAGEEASERITEAKDD